MYDLNDFNLNVIKEESVKYLDILTVNKKLIEREEDIDIEQALIKLLGGKQYEQ